MKTWNLTVVSFRNQSSHTYKTDKGLLMTVNKVTNILFEFSHMITHNYTFYYRPRWQRISLTWSSLCQDNQNSVFTSHHNDLLLPGTSVSVFGVSHLINTVTDCQIYIKERYRYLKLIWCLIFQTRHHMLQFFHLDTKYANQWIF
jgi:hypothetical protein